MRPTLVAIALIGASSIEAQAPTAESRKPIQDNSFLLEEAYNQEAAVIQHINSVIFNRVRSNWQYALTDEWPVTTQRHQLSITIPLENSTVGNTAALGDVMLNYRLQLVGSGETRLAVTPRLTVIFPTAAKELGGGTLGFQGALASSFVATPVLVLHTNAGLTLRPSVESGVGRSDRLLDLNAGQSVVWLADPRVNFMLEAVVASVESFTGIGINRTRNAEVIVSPAMRWSYDFASGLQIVPGIAFPIGFRANKGDRGLLLYLSFEHELPGLPR